MPSVNSASIIVTTAPTDTLPASGNKYNTHWHEYGAVNLANLTGGSLTTGDAVALSATCSDAVVTADVQGSLQAYRVNRGGIAAAATSGEFAVYGRTLVTVQGAVSNGAWLRKSATAKSLEDSGVLVGSTAGIPSGALAIAETSSTGAGAGTVIANLLGFSLPPIGRVTGKGSLIVGTAANQVTEVPAGTNGYVLTAASAQVAGVNWQDPAPLVTSLLYFIQAYSSSPLAVSLPFL